MYSPVLIEAPTTMPVSRTEAKAALDITYSEKDAMIDGLIAAATSLLEGPNAILNGRCLSEQTWRQDFDAFDTCLRLPLLPVLSAVVTYKDADGVTQTVAGASYSVREDESGAYIEFSSGFSLPTVSTTAFPAVSVEYVAGYEVGGDIPMPAGLKQAILLIVRSLFDNPSGAVVGATVADLPFGPRAMLMPYVRMTV